MQFNAKFSTHDDVTINIVDLPRKSKIVYVIADSSNFKFNDPRNRHETNIISIK